MKIADLVNIYKDLYVANLEFFVKTFKEFKDFRLFLRYLKEVQGADIPIYENGGFVNLPPNLDSYLCIDSQCFRKLRKEFQKVNPLVLNYPDDYDHIYRILSNCLCKREFIKLLLEIETQNIKGRNSLYAFIRNNFEKEKAEQLISTLKGLKEFSLSDAVEIIFEILHHSRRKNITPTGNFTLVFYPFYSLDFTKQTLKNLEKIASNKSLVRDIEKVVENLGKKKSLLNFINTQKGECIQKALKGYIDVLTNCLREWSKNPSLEMLSEQKKLIEDWVYNGNIYVEGVPGASKTFSGVAALLFAALVDTTIVFPKASVFNYFITGNTYKSLKEFIKKLVDFAQCSHFKRFVSNLMNEIGCSTDENIGLRGITVYFHISKSEMEKAGANTCEEYIEKLKEEINVKGESEIKLSCGCSHCRGNCITIYIPFSKRRADDGLIFHCAVLRKVITSHNECFKYVDSLHLEEASQITFASLVEVLDSIKETKFFQNALMGQNWWRFSFSGDPLQLSPIYQRADGVKNLLALGVYYNLFTYFGVHSHNRRRLKTSLRVPQPLVEFVKEFYGGEISALKANCECYFNSDISLRGNCKNAENLKEALKALSQLKECILRVEYTLRGNGTFPRPRKFNPVEIEIVKIIREILEDCESCSKAYLTPFRMQEMELKKVFNEPCEIVGTVDKLQGDEKDTVFFLPTVEDKDYAVDLIDFLFNPNRLNVAITRTKRLFILVHSSNLKEIAFTEFNQSFEDEKNLFVSSYLLKNPYVSGKNLEQLLKFLNSNEGLFIFQKLVSRASKPLGKFELYFDTNLNRKRGLCSPSEVVAEVSLFGVA